MLKKIYSLFKLKFILLFFGVIFSFTLILTGFYVFPASDDYYFAHQFRTITYWPFQKFFYFEWSGRYTANLLLPLNPIGYSNLMVYKLMPVIWYIFIFGATFFFLKTFFNNYLKKNKVAIIALFFCSIFFSGMPSIAQGIFWFSGAATYLSSIILLLVFLTLLLKFHFSNTKNKKILFAIALVLTEIFLIGTNEVMLVLVTGIISGIFVIQCMYKQTNKLFFFLLFILALLCCTFSIIAPGNHTRMEEYTNYNHHFFSSIIFSIITSLKYILIWTIQSPLIWLSLLSLPLLHNFISHLKKIPLQEYFVHPAFAIMLWIMLMSAAIFTGYWSMGAALPSRADNVLYFFFIGGWCYCWLCLLMNNKTSKYFLHIKYNSGMKTMLIIGLITALLQPYNNFSIIYQDLINGKIQNFQRIHQQRIHLLDTYDKCVLPPLTAQPKSIFVDDISFDSTDWRNQNMMHFYNKKCIVADSTFYIPRRP